MRQSIKCDCYVTCNDETKIISLYKNLIIEFYKDEKYSDWVDLEIEGTQVHIYGESYIDCVYIPGCKATRYEPKEYGYLEDAISTEELKKCINAFIYKSDLYDLVCEIEHDNTMAEDLYDVIERELAENELYI